MSLCRIRFNPCEISLYHMKLKLCGTRFNPHEIMFMLDLFNPSEMHLT